MRPRSRVAAGLGVLALAVALPVGAAAAARAGQPTQPPPGVNGPTSVSDPRAWQPAPGRAEPVAGIDGADRPGGRADTGGVDGADRPGGRQDRPG